LASHVLRAFFAYYRPGGGGLADNHIFDLNWSHATYGSMTKATWLIFPIVSSNSPLFVLMGLLMEARRTGRKSSIRPARVFFPAPRAASLASGRNP